MVGDIHSISHSMKLAKIKLQPEDLRGIKVIFKHVYEAPIEDIAKAAQLKLLEWLKKEDMLAHDSFGHTAYKQDGEWVEGELHSPNCQVCKVMSELESKLKESHD